MHAQNRTPSYARLNSFHTPKHQLIGSSAAHVPPAWKGASSSATGAKGKQAMTDPGSKILLSRLPVDVGEAEVEELFKKTVGPLKESFLIYNSQGKSKGMAIVSFQRSGDAAVARTKYDGKIVDGRRPIRIEIISDELSPPTPPSAPSLFERIGGISMNNRIGPPAAGSLPKQPRKHNAPADVTAQAGPVPPRKLRVKKGPKRIQKQLVKKSREQLDREMEDYRASADGLKDEAL